MPAEEAMIHQLCAWFFQLRAAAYSLSAISDNPGKSWLRRDSEGPAIDWLRMQESTKATNGRSAKLGREE